MLGTKTARGRAVPLALTAAVAALALGAVSPALAAAPSASPAAAAAPDDGGIVRSMTRNKTLHFPAATAMGKPGGVRAPEIRREGEGDEGSGGSDEGSGPLASTLKPPTAGSSGVDGSAGLVNSWLGLDAFDQRYANGGNQFSVEPPDQALCTGGGYVLESVNTVLRVYRSSGAPATAVTDLNTFYGYPAQINRTTGVVGPFLTDPTCVFDHGSGRFYLVVLTIDVDPATGDFTGGNHLDLAVSRTSNPTGQWDIFRLPVQDDGTQGTPRHTDCPCIGDYPHIGSDANAIFVTTNEYPFSDDPGRYGNNFNGAQIYVMDKAALARAASTVRVVQFENTSLPSGSSRVPGFTVWPAQVPDSRYDTSAGGTEYLLSSIAGEEAQPTKYTGMADQIGVYAVTNTSSIRSASPRLSLQRALVKSQVYGDPPPLVKQKVGPVPLRDCILANCNDILGAGVTPPRHESEGPIAANDSRMQQVYYSGGLLYGALTTVLRVNGARQAGIAWFAVDPASPVRSSTVKRQGYVGVGGNNVMFPAIAVLSNGTGAMVFTLVGADYYPTAAYARFSGSGFGAVQIAARGRAPQDGFTEYKGFLNPGEQLRPRWGDYSAAQTEGSRIFMATEYIQSRCTFAEFRTDMTCGGTRAPLINWATRVAVVTP